MEIDFNNWDQLLDLMAHHEEYPTMLMGQNTDGEFVTTSIYSDKVVTETSQANGWVRTTTYYKDFTIENTYRKDPA